MPTVAFFPGSFDPFTRGHQDIALRASRLYDRLIVAIGSNTNKKTRFPLASRLSIIRDSLRGVENVSLLSYEGLTIDAARAHGATVLIRGLRTPTDYEYEAPIAQTNHMIAPEIETVFLVSRPEHINISSTVVRDLLHYNHDAARLLPEGVDLTQYERT